MRRYLVLMVATVWASVALGADSLGQIAQNMNGPIDMARQVFSFVSIVVGIFFLFSAFLRYLRFRQNSQEAPISSVVVYFLVGIAFICIPLAHQISLLFAAHAGVANVVS